MAPKKSNIVLNVEQFIRDVEERPAIWNRNFHCNKAFLEQMWDELSTEHKLPKVVLKAKWKGLRDNFRVEYKRIPRADNGEFTVDPAVFESKWIHYYALLFLTEHMRHRMPKNEQDQTYYFPQQSQDCEEKTVIEPDLTNGLIRRMQDSDEEFDEDDVDDEELDEPQQLQLTTPPAAHSNSYSSSLNNGVPATIKTEDARSLLKGVKSILKAHAAMMEDDDAEKEAQDLSKKSTESICKSPTISSSSITSLSSTSILTNPLLNMLTPSSSSTSTSTTCSNQSAGSSLAAAAVVAAAAAAASQQQHKKRSVSPPPLYNKAHHPTSAALTSAAVLSKEREEFSTLNSVQAANCLHGSHEHLNFTKHSYANGLIPALKLKRPRLSEDSNFNGSSTMDATVPIVPEDDDYHYLLSLHPYMKQLTAAQKLRIRTKIQKLIFKELYKEDLEEMK